MLNQAMLARLPGLHRHKTCSVSTLQPRAGRGVSGMSHLGGYMVRIPLHSLHDALCMLLDLFSGHAAASRGNRPAAEALTWIAPKALIWPASETLPLTRGTSFWRCLIRPLPATSQTSIRQRNALQLLKGLMRRDIPFRIICGMPASLKLTFLSCAPSQKPLCMQHAANSACSMLASLQAMMRLQVARASNLP